MLAHDKKDVPIFTAESIKGMGPSGQGIAQILQHAGWIQVVDDSEGVKAE
jgi:hypothetical protein